MRTRLPAVAVAAVSAALSGAALAGCDDSPSRPGSAASITAAWTEPDHYAYTLLSSCGERGGLGLFRVWVRDGAVARAEPLRQGSDLLPLSDMPTIGDLLRSAAEAQGDGADKVLVTRAPDGRPRRVSIDYLAKAIDDEACYRITGLRRLTS
jgi:hypothetical protein